MEANHPHLTTQKTLYVEIIRARDRAELVTDDRSALRERLEAATGERIAALEAVEHQWTKERGGRLKTACNRDRDGRARGAEQMPSPAKAREPHELEL